MVVAQDNAWDTLSSPHDTSSGEQRDRGSRLRPRELPFARLVLLSDAGDFARDHRFDDLR